MSNTVLANKPPGGLIIHGLLMRSPSMIPLQHRLRQRGVACDRFDYRSRGDWERNRQQLATLIADHRIIIAHSLGGRLALAALRQQPALARLVIMLGTPLTPASTARASSRVGLGRRLLGGAASALTTVATAPPQSIQTVMIAGDRGLGLGRLFNPRMRGDGTVALCETQADWLHQHHVLPVSHSGLMLGNKVLPLVVDLINTFASEHQLGDNQA